MCPSFPFSRIWFSFFLFFFCGAYVNISSLYRSGPTCWGFLLFFCCFVALFGAGVSAVGCFHYFGLFSFIRSLMHRCRPPSAAHPPSKDWAPPYVLASSCAAWTLGGWKCHRVCNKHRVWNIPPPPDPMPPPPPFSIQRREMNGNKIFSCHHPCFGLVQATPFCLKKVVCERMTSPSPLPGVNPSPPPPSSRPSDSPTFF